MQINNRTADDVKPNHKNIIESDNESEELKLPTQKLTSAKSSKKGSESSKDRLTLQISDKDDIDSVSSRQVTKEDVIEGGKKAASPI